jgi:hypothetical protein
MAGKRSRRQRSSKGIRLIPFEPPWHSTAGAYRRVSLKLNFTFVSPRVQIGGDGAPLMNRRRGSLVPARQTPFTCEGMHPIWEGSASFILALCASLVTTPPKHTPLSPLLGLAEALLGMLAARLGMLY